uniref:Bifunctional inhibitor/plant lipid transfer protein/seed storage helical domain-containing protein n=1 Tax=Oryza brachyantha TaxID=4533 RepID=J3M9G2_ORYBR
MAAKASAVLVLVVVVVVLRAHPASCFCQYKKDPNMKKYVNSPNGKKVFAACKVPLPKC